MKKLSVVVLLSLLLVSSFGFVSAQANFFGAGRYQSSVNGVDNVVNNIAEFLSPLAVFLLGSDSDGILQGDQLFVKVLVFLLVLTIVLAAARKMPLLQDKPTSSFFVAAIVSIIGVRFITTDRLIEFIWLPANTFAASFVAIAVFATLFFTIEMFDSRVVRRFSWVLILCTFFYFSIDRINNPPPGVEGNGVSWMYLIVALASGVLIFADRQIHAILYTGAHNKIVDRGKRIQAINLQYEIDELYRTLARATTPGERSAVQAQINTKTAALQTMYH